MRRNYLIKRDIQFRFSAMTFVFISLSALTVWYLMKLVVNAVVEGGAHSVDGTFLTSSYLIVMAAIIVDSVAVFLISMYFSHCIAGPIYRMEKALREYLETGHTTPITLRKNDMLGETVALLNRVLAPRGKPKKRHAPPEPTR